MISEAGNAQCADAGAWLQNVLRAENALCNSDRDAVTCGAGMTFRLAGERNVATYRWDRDARSLKEPSGTLEMSLPWRVLKRKHRSGVNTQ